MAYVTFRAANGQFGAERIEDGRYANLFNLKNFVRATGNEGAVHPDWHKHIPSKCIKDYNVAIADKGGRGCGTEYYVTEGTLETLIANEYNRRHGNASHQNTEVPPGSNFERLLEKLAGAVCKIGEKIDDHTGLFNGLFSRMDTVDRTQQETKEKIEEVGGWMHDIDLKLDTHAEEIKGLHKTDEKLAAWIEQLQNRSAAQDQTIADLKARLDRIEGQEPGKGGFWRRGR